MKKIFSIFLVLILSISFSGCGLFNVNLDEFVDSTENAQKVYFKVNESKAILDLVATDVCAAWKDASLDYNLSTKDVNDAIENAINAHSDNIVKINELDKEICDLFAKAKDETKNIFVESALKQVMTAYFEYKDSILKANEALETRGYIDISLANDSLDSALQDLFVEL